MLDTILDRVMPHDFAGFRDYVRRVFREIDEVFDEQADSELLNFMNLPEKDPRFLGRLWIDPVTRNLKVSAG